MEFFLLLVYIKTFVCFVCCQWRGSLVGSIVFHFIKKMMTKKKLYL